MYIIFVYNSKCDGTTLNRVLNNAGLNEIFTRNDSPQNEHKRKEVHRKFMDLSSSQFLPHYTRILQQNWLTWEYRNNAGLNEIFTRNDSPQNEHKRKEVHWKFLDLSS